MDNLRIVLFISLALVGTMIYSDWQKEVGQSAPVTEQQVSNVSTAEDLPKAVDNDAPTAPVTVNEAVQSAPVDNGIQQVRVKTDVLDVVIDIKGGNLVSSHLTQFTVELGDEETIQLQNPANNQFFAIQSGLLASDSVAPNHHAAYQAQRAEYVLADNENELIVPLVWKQDGIEVTKSYTFKKGDYLVGLNYQINNQSDKDWSGYQYRQLQRGEIESGNSFFINTYTGGVIYSQEEKYEKIPFDDMEEETLNRNIAQGWAAIIQHYFLTAIVPNKDETNNYYSKVVNADNAKRYVLGLTSPRQTVMVGQSQEFKTQLYIGPKNQDKLESIAEGLELTVDYGMLTVISKPLFWALSFIHDFVGNWGWAIILLTVGIKLIFYPLSETSYRSMAKMRKVTPEMQKIRERHADDRQRQSQELMKLYQKEKINPLGGCLPMLIQIPVFIALYWALLESVELRQAPFMFWIQDLSVHDPHFILPLIMGLTMFIQQKLNPTPPDPMQAKVFMMMPIVFTFFFMMFPAGLVLYWVTNNTLSILQQWVITRRIESGKE